MAVAALEAEGQLYDHPSSRTIHEDLITNIHEYIVKRTGRQPVDYDHIQRFQAYMDDFIHPNPRCLRELERFGTIPHGNNNNVIAGLSGWNEISVGELPTIMDVFNRFNEEERQLAYDSFFCEQGRAPTVREFSRYLLTLEGNENRDSSRKTLGNLFLRSKEQERSLEQNYQTITMLNEILDSKDAINAALGEADTRNRRDMARMKEEMETLRIQRQNLQHDKGVLEEEIRKVTAENQDLKDQSAKFLSDVEMMEDERVRLEGLIEAVDEKLGVVEAKLIVAESENKRLLECVEYLNKEKEILREGLTTVTQDKDRLEQDKDRLEKTLTTVTHDKDRLEQDKDRLEQDKDRLEQTLTTVTHDKDRLEQDKDRLEQDKDRLEQDKDRLEQDKDRLEQDMDRLEQTLTTVTHDKDRLEQDKDRLEQDKDRLEQTLTTVTQDKDRLEQTLTTVTHDKDRLEQDKDRLEQTLTTVTHDKDRLEQDKDRLEQDKDRLEQDKDRLEQDKNRLTQEREHNQRQLLLYKILVICLIFAFLISLVTQSQNGQSVSS